MASWAAGSTPCSKTHLSEPELHGATEGHGCMNVNLVVTAAAGLLATGTPILLHKRHVR